MPDIQIPEILEGVLYTKKKLVVLIGGRDGAKSETLARVLIHRCQTEGADILCGREYQNSIDDSVHKIIKSLIESIPVPGFSVTEKKIDCRTGGGFRFKGLNRNPEAVKSAQGFKYFWGEEAQKFSQQTIDDLLPTIRAKDSQLFFTANPVSSTDPFSKRFINPYLDSLKSFGWHEDDMHLIIEVNWRHNPWHEELEPQRQWDYENLPRAKYDHIWEGAFSDGVDDALILPEWFDACVDAHLKLGFTPIGIRYSSHDPSDTGEDAKGFAFRHGSVVLDVQEKTTGSVNEGCFWATNLAINHNSDAFTWDCDGLGSALNHQVSQAFDGKHVTITPFKGSEEVDFPDAIFEKADHAIIVGQRTNKDALRNKRAQYYYELRNRIYRTWEAVENKKYHDPDRMISFSGDISALPMLRSELCRMPIKPNGNGFFEMYRKDDMKTKFKFKSPNLADSVMMLMRTPPKPLSQNTYMPKPIKTLGVNRYGQIRS